MQLKFLKNVNLLYSAVVFAVALASFAGFVYLTKANPVTNEIKRLTNRSLPEANLLEIETKNDFYNEARTGDVVLVYLISTCDACKLELQMIAESNLDSQTKIYGVMAENEEIVKKYVKKNNIKFPVVIDKNGALLEGLEIKYFPANLKLKDGVVKNVILGAPENGQKFLNFVRN